MDFWRIWRLILRRIYLVLSLAFVTASLVLVGFFVQNLRAGVAADARLTLQQAKNLSTDSNSSSDTGTSARISELVTQLRNNNNIYLEAAELLRLDEAKRKKEVLAILERNNFFAPLDTKVQDEVDQLIATGEIPPQERAAQIAQNQDAIRQAQAALLAAPRDRQGTFEPEGVKTDPAEIADVLRQQVDVIPVASLLTTENQPQYDNQIQLLGRFGRAAEATLYLNMLCVAFVNDYSIGSQASGKIRIADLTRKKEEAERQRAAAVARLSAFKNRGEFEAMIGQDATGQNLVALEAELAKLRGDRDGALQAMQTLAQELRSTKKTTTIVLPADESAAYRSAQQDVERLRIEVNRLGVTKGDNDPELKAMRGALQSALAIAKRAHKSTSQSQPNPNYTALEGALATARTRYAASEAQLKPIEARFRKLQERLRRSPALQGEVNKLLHDLETVEKALAVIDQTLQREKLDNIKSGRVGTLLISRAHVLPSKNTWPNAVRLWAYATVLALLFGVALIVGLDAIDNKVRTKRDVERLFGLPVSGEIPAHLPDPRRAPRVTYLDPLSPTAEAYRLLRTEIQFTAIEYPFQSLLVATCKPGQGATTTVSNLAITLAQSGKRVILVDADLRHPRLHHAFALNNDQGLTTLLMGAAVAIDAVLQHTEIENLLLLTSGPLPLNPSELLGSSQMQELHARLKSVADIVLFDAPSAVVFSDTTVLASMADATLLVIRAGDIPRGVVEQVKERLVRSRANLLGVVLNATPSEMVDSVYYHDQYYPLLRESRNPDISVPIDSATELEDPEKPADALEGQIPVSTSVKPVLTVSTASDDEESELNAEEFFGDDISQIPRRFRSIPRG